MIAQIALNRVVPFVVAIVIGAAAAAFLNGISNTAGNEIGTTPGYGSGGASDSGTQFVPSAPQAMMGGVVIFAKPKAVYTDLARENEVEGNVKLRVTLQADGRVGAIKVLEGLPDGLTEQAIDAARQIKFRPATVNGEPVSKTVTLQYGFTIY